MPLQHHATSHRIHATKRPTRARIDSWSTRGVAHASCMVLAEAPPSSWLPVPREVWPHVARLGHAAVLQDEDARSGVHSRHAPQRPPESLVLLLCASARAALRKRAEAASAPPIPISAHCTERPSTTILYNYPLQLSSPLYKRRSCAVFDDYGISAVAHSMNMASSRRLPWRRRKGRRASRLSHTKRRSQSQRAARGSRATAVRARAPKQQGGAVKKQGGGLEAQGGGLEAQGGGLEERGGLGSGERAHWKPSGSGCSLVSHPLRRAGGAPRCSDGASSTTAQGRGLRVGRGWYFRAAHYDSAAIRGASVVHVTALPSSSIASSGCTYASSGIS